MEVRARRRDIEAAGVRCIAVGFSPPDAIARLATHIEWPWPFLVDESRSVYARLGATRATWRNVYTAATLQRYLRAAFRGVLTRVPVEDTRQLGADAVIRNGRAVWVHRPRSPDDRPAVETLLDQLRVAGPASAS